SDVADYLFFFESEQISLEVFRTFRSYSVTGEQKQTLVVTVSDLRLSPAKDVIVKIIDVSALEAARKSRDLPAIAESFRQLVDKQRKLTGPYALGAFCDPGGALCLEMADARFATSGSVTLSQVREAESSEGGPRFRYDLDLDLQFAASASADAEPS